MATFRRFEDIQAWQRSREVAAEIYKISSTEHFGRDFDLRSQIRRSSVSIMANIAEGQGRRTDKDFAHFLNISLGSVVGTKSHLYLALDLGYVDKENFELIYAKIDEIGRMIFGLSSHLRKEQK